MHAQVVLESLPEQMFDPEAVAAGFMPTEVRACATRACLHACMDGCVHFSLSLSLSHTRPSACCDLRDL